jgi:hypothetical protein
LDVIVGVCDGEEEEGKRVSRDQVGVERSVSTSSFKFVGRVVWKWRFRLRERCRRSVRCAIVGDSCGGCLV